MAESITGHVDTFCADMSPPPELWPERVWTGVPELSYSDWMNCAASYWIMQSQTGGEIGPSFAFRKVRGRIVN